MLDLKRTPMPILIKNYADAFGVTVRMQNTQAYTDGKVINIPRLDLNDPISGRMAYGFLAHECAHIKYTDMKLFYKIAEESKLKKHIFNILEDLRVEKLISKRFIGVYENLQLLWEVQLDDFKKVLDKNCLNLIPLMELVLSFIHLYGASKVQEFSVCRSVASKIYHAVKQRGYNHLTKIASLVKEVNQAKNSNDILELTLKIITLLTDSDKNLNNENDIIEDCKDSEKTNSKNLNNKNSNKKSGENSERTKRQGRASNAKKRSELNITEYENEYGEGTLFSDDTGTIVKSASELVEFKASTNPMGSSARDDLGVLKDARCTARSKDILQEANQYFRVRNTLRSKLNSYVDYYKSGYFQGHRLNVYKAQNVRTGEFKIFERKVAEDDFSTSVQILVDASSSMMSTDGREQDRCYDACVSALNMALGLEGLEGIYSAVRFFPGVSTEYETALEFNEKASRFIEYFDQRPRGSTPLAQGLYGCLEKLKKISCNRNIIVILTDGVPDSVDQATRAIKACNDEGVEIYTIGIHSDAFTHYIDDYPKENFSKIEHTGELNDALLSVFSKAFHVDNVA